MAAASDRAGSCSFAPGCSTAADPAGAESSGKNDDFRADVRTIPDPDDRGVREGASVRALGIGPAADRTIANVFNLQRFDEI